MSELDHSIDFYQDINTYSHALTRWLDNSELKWHSSLYDKVLFIYIAIGNIISTYDINASARIRV